MPGDLVWEHRRVDDTQTLDAMHAQLRVHSARHRVLSHAHRRRLSEGREVVSGVVHITIM